LKVFVNQLGSFGIQLRTDSDRQTHRKKTHSVTVRHKYRLTDTMTHKRTLAHTLTHIYIHIHTHRQIHNINFLPF